MHELTDVEKAHAKVLLAEGDVVVAREHRANVIREAVAAGISLRGIGRAIGMTHEAVRKIAR